MTEPAVQPLAVRVGDIPGLLGVSKRTAYRWAAEGILPTVRVGGVVMIPYAELLRWWDAQQHPGRHVARKRAS